VTKSAIVAAQITDYEIEGDEPVKSGVGEDGIKDPEIGVPMDR
jgi:hypothetical protein